MTSRGQEGQSRRSRRPASTRSTSTRVKPRASKPRLTRDVEVQAFTAFEDASGAAAKLSWRGHTFTFNLPGDVRCHLVQAPPGRSRVPARVAQLVCTYAFLTMLCEAVDADWLERNVRIHGR